MKMIQRWRCNASANADRNTGAKRFGVRELRQTCWNPDASEAEEKGCGETAEAEQGQGLAFSLSAALALRPLSLRLFPRQAIPRQATACNLRADDSKAFRVRQLAPVVPKALFVKVPEQVERLNADVRAVQLAFNEAPEVLHCVRVDVATDILYGMVYDGVLVLNIRQQARRRISGNR